MKCRIFLNWIFLKLDCYQWKDFCWQEKVYNVRKTLNCFIYYHKDSIPDVIGTIFFRQIENRYHKGNTSFCRNLFKHQNIFHVKSFSILCFHYSLLYKTQHLKYIIFTTYYYVVLFFNSLKKEEVFNSNVFICMFVVRLLLHMWIDFQIYFHIWKVIW